MIQSFLRTHGLNLLLLALLPAALFPQTLFQGKSLATHDILQWRAGAESLIEYAETTGETALWATDMFAGMPAYPISNVGPMTSLDSLVNLFGKAVFPWLHYVTLLVGAYVLALMVGASPLAALFAAVLIGFTTYIPIIIGAGHYTKFHAYVWTPWMLAGFARVLKGDWKLGIPMFAFFLSMQVRAGHPQVTFYFLFLLAIWWAVDTFARVRSGDWKPVAAQTGLLTVAGLLALASILPQTLSLNEYTDYSIRGGSALAEAGASGGLDQNYAFTWSQGWGEMLTLLVPNLYGGSEQYWGSKPGTAGPHYFSMLGFLFLLAAFATKPGRIEKSFLTAAVVGMAFSLGAHFPLLNQFMFDHFPLFNKFRTPEMWLMMSCLSLAIPAAFGFDRAITAAKSVSLKPLWLAGGTGLAVGLLVFLSLGSGFGFERPGERTQYAEQLARQNGVSPEDPRVVQAVDNFLDTNVIPARESLARTDALRYLVFLLLGAAAWWAVRAKGMNATAAAYLVVLMAAYDMVSVGKRYIPERVFVENQTDPAQVLDAQAHPVDLWLAENTRTSEGWKERVLPLDQNPFNNAIPSYHYASIGGYSGAKLSIYQDFLDSGLFSGPRGVNTAALAMLNVRYLTWSQQGEVPGFEWLMESEGRHVYRAVEMAPKAWFVDSVRVVEGPREAFEWLRSSPAAWRTTAVVEGATAMTSTPADSATVRITRYDNHHITIETERGADGYLVIGELWYPAGWNAYLDGQPVAMAKTNYLLRGLPVPAGSHTIELRFEPGWLWAQPVGFGVNAFLLLLMVGAGGLRLYKRG